MQKDKTEALEAFDKWVRDPERWTAPHGVLTKAEEGLCLVGETIRKALSQPEPVSVESLKRDPKRYTWNPDNCVGYNQAIDDLNSKGMLNNMVEES